MRVKGVQTTVMVKFNMLKGGLIFWRAQRGNLLQVRMA
jgi:hypothetical protein